jgi:hypothetical protein
MISLLAKKRPPMLAAHQIVDWTLSIFVTRVAAIIARKMDNMDVVRGLLTRVSTLGLKIP